MLLATWNVNSLKVRLDHTRSWLQAVKPDVLCLQELKCETAAVPVDAFKEIGYQVVANGQKTYNGVAILARSVPQDVVMDIPGFADEQRRVIAATIDGTRVISAYVPNGQAIGSDKYEYKLRWFAAFTEYVKTQLAQHAALAVLGDYNVAPEDRDVHDPKAWEGQVLVSEPERQAFRALLAVGLTDSFRLFEQPEKSYSWWDYRMLGFRRNAGLRIDHVLLSESLAKECTACVIDKAPRKLEKPSDHAPVMATIR